MKFRVPNKPILFLLAIAVSALISILLIVSMAGSTGEQYIKTDEPITFNVKKGDSLNSIIENLVKLELIESSLLLKVNLRLNRDVYPPKAGHFEILPEMTLHELLTDISDGEEKTYSITMIEGLTWQQWLAQLKQSSFIEIDATTQEIVASLGENVNSLEGILLPETYNVRYGTTLTSFVNRMHQDMQSYLNSAWQNRQGMLPIQSSYEALILASIIEKETGVAHERPRIASVFVNRLRDGMRLQTDPTVIYGLGERFDGDIKRTHLREKTPYNTYVINGLPPTPIAMPGKSAIDAALNPAYTDEFYFVSKGDGSHQFSKTLKEHNNAVRKFQLGLE